MNLEHALQLGLHAEQPRLDIRHVGVPGDLPEARHGDRRLAAQRLGAGAARLVDQDVEAGGVELLVDDVANRLQVQRARDEQVPDPEMRIGRHRRAQPGLAQPPRPKLARDVGLDAGAVAFAVDKAGAVPHMRQRAQRALEGAVGAVSSLADAHDQGARVVLCAVGGIERSIGPNLGGWHKALPLVFWCGLR